MEVNSQPAGSTSACAAGFLVPHPALLDVRNGECHEMGKPPEFEVVAREGGREQYLLCTEVPPQR